MISEPEARASLFHALKAQTFTREQFDQYLDGYLRQRASEARSVEVRRQDPELAAFIAIREPDYTEAMLAVKSMAPKDRAVLEFWAGELAGLVSHVQLTEERFPQ